MKLLTFTKKDDGMYYVTDHYQHKPTSPQNTEQEARELCRMRLGKLLQDYDLYVLKVPFINLWLVW